MVKLTYRGQNVGYYNTKALATWKINQLIKTSPLNWVKTNFKIEKV